GAGCDIDRRRTMMPVRAQLSYDVLVSGLAPVHDDPMPDGGKPHWSPLAHTLIHGPTEAVVVDPPITVAQTNALADWIESFGKTLRHIYITHWHADHWLGTSQLLGRFPGAVVYASAATVDRIVTSTPGGVPAALWTNLFPEQLPDHPLEIVPQPVPEDGFTIDGERLLSVEVGHSDTDDTTVLHAPSIGLVAAGDVVYNNVHQYLAETPGGGFEAWHAALDAVAALHPARVVAGHKDPARNDDVGNIAETRGYLDEAARLLATEPSRIEFFFRMVERYPERINPYTTWLSARRLLPE
ncbi:MAG TPA: MBL fold metallo-hydrolase, partial [Candidatus Dormibacteraeota bacterium]|nr:MBL fold metallo-hydrolase [Candidatus Dormibacteraeota bacterium]